jgi:hypothetical protein
VKYFVRFVERLRKALDPDDRLYPTKALIASYEFYIPYNLTETPLYPIPLQSSRFFGLGFLPPRRMIVIAGEIKSGKHF